jgi:PPOX class probable F420-dependent enzyme
VADTFEDVARSKYLLLTTFTKDGRPKPTAVWGAPDGDELLIITGDGSWKTKRIRNTPRVTIQKSGALGTSKGAPVEAVARILPREEGASTRCTSGWRSRPRARQVLVEEREDAAVGILGCRGVVPESGDPQQRLAR